MGRYNYQVIKVISFGNEVELDDVQSITVRKGRAKIQDPFKANTATISGRNPDNLPTLEIGNNIYIKWTRSTSNGFVYLGQVANFRIEYGRISEEDVWHLDLEDGVAKAGRAFTSSSFSWSAGLRTDQAADDAADDCGIDLVPVNTTLSYNSIGSSFVSAQSLPNQNLLEILNQLAVTEQGRIVGSGYDKVGWINRMDIGLFGYQCSITDGTLTAQASEIPFMSVAFSSLADSYYDSVLVQPVGLTAQQAGTTDRKYVVNTYDQTTTQANDLADYILATLDVKDAVPLTVSTIAEIQSNDALMDAFNVAGRGIVNELILRGTSYNIYLEGGVLTATPSQTRVSFDVISNNAINFFVLDSDIFGKLDEDKLGF